MKILIVGFCILWIFSGICFAESSNDDLRNEIKALKEQLRIQEEKIKQLEERLAKEEARPTIQLGNGAIEDLDRYVLGGINIEGGATFIVQATDNANGSDLSQGGEDVTDGSYSIDLFVKKDFDDYGKALIHIEPGDGQGVEDELQVFSNVNRDSNDTDNSGLVTEVYYEHYFKSVPLNLAFGKMDGTILIDTNTIANDETTQFLGRIFRNSPVIEFPDNTLGLKMDIKFVDFLEARFLMMDADTDWEDIGDEGFFATQWNLKPHLFERDGNYRIIGWLNDSHHTKWDNPSDNKKSSYGFGVSVDQGITDSLGIFLRYGWQDPDVYLNSQSFSLEQSWSMGLQFNGDIWGRNNDVLGLAIGQVMPSNKYKKSDPNLKAKDEGHFEAYYNYKVNPHLTLSPDIQIIWNPYGGDAQNGDDTITVLGLRGQVDF